MIKTQVQLTEEQLSLLRQLAAEEGVSVSELVRRGVSQLLQSRHSVSRDELWRRVFEAAGKFHSGLPDVAQRHDDYLAEDFGR